MFLWQTWFSVHNFDQVETGKKIEKNPIVIKPWQFPWTYLVRIMWKTGLPGINFSNWSQVVKIHFLRGTG